MTKPIALYSYPEGFYLGNNREKASALEVTQMFNKAMPDYYWLVFPSTFLRFPKLEVFYEKDMTEVEYDELVEIVRKKAAKIANSQRDKERAIQVLRHLVSIMTIKDNFKAKNMVKMRSFRTFKIDSGCFDFPINFCISNDIPRVAKWVNFKTELPSKNNCYVIKETDFDCLGKRIYIPGYCPIIWLPRFPITPKEFGTLYHEIFHAICDVTRWVGVELTESSEEVFCHLIGHITKQFFEVANKK